MIFRHVTFLLPLGLIHSMSLPQPPIPRADQCVEIRLVEDHRLCLVVRTTVAFCDGGFVLIIDMLANGDLRGIRVICGLGFSDRTTDLAGGSRRYDLTEGCAPGYYRSALYSIPG